MLERIVADLVETVERRYHGKYRGFVVSNEDPARLGRLQLKVPSVLGDDVVTGWATPCALYGGAANEGILFIPERDAGVWVEFEEGDLEFPVWVGTFWTKSDGKSGLPKAVAADGAEQGEVQQPPTRKIIKTKKGHTIQFEDAKEKELILIREGRHGHLLTMDKDGITITLTIDNDKDKKKNTIVVSDKGITLTTDNDKDKKKNTIVVSDKGITLTTDNDKDKKKNTIVMSDEGLQLTADGTITIHAAKNLELKSDGDITLDASNVKVKVKVSMDVS
jgi:uncharacterized protein involved in type VI secretion and phage assembly